ncbi:integrase core domain-containing protein [Kitasatospora sp. NPDC048540]|uniref:integrase core domain-containing protein n=1 Tax=unclassified Kitasatospora TaxID=2633591 RepID=UPI0009EC5CE0
MNRSDFSRVGSCFDNAAAQASISLLKVEHVRRHRFATRTAARIKIATWIADFGNTRRRHTRADGLPPTEFERIIRQCRQPPSTRTRPHREDFTKRGDGHLLPTRRPPDSRSRGLTCWERAALRPGAAARPERGRP